MGMPRCKQSVAVHQLSLTVPVPVAVMLRMPVVRRNSKKSSERISFLTVQNNIPFLNIIMYIKSCQIHEYIVTYTYVINLYIFIALFTSFLHASF